MHKCASALCASLGLHPPLSATGGGGLRPSLSRSPSRKAATSRVTWPLRCGLRGRLPVAITWARSVVPVRCGRPLYPQSVLPHPPEKVRWASRPTFFCAKVSCNQAQAPYTSPKTPKRGGPEGVQGATGKPPALFRNPHPKGNHPQPFTPTSQARLIQCEPPLVPDPKRKRGRPRRGAGGDRKAPCLVPKSASEGNPLDFYTNKSNRIAISCPFAHKKGRHTTVSAKGGRGKQLSQSPRGPAHSRWRRGRSHPRSGCLRSPRRRPRSSRCKRRPRS